MASGHGKRAGSAHLQTVHAALWVALAKCGTGVCMNVAVTGATGHIGASLVRQLIARGDDVRVMLHTNNGQALEGLDVATVTGDVTDPASLEAAFADAEVVYHLAALISITGAQGGRVARVNVEGARNVAQACMNVGVRRLVHFCSVHAFCQEPLHEPLEESRARVPPVGGRHPAYDRSKAEGERAVRSYLERGLDVVIVHPSGVIGPFDFAPSRMGQVFLDLFHGRLPSLIDGGFDWVDARDVARGAIAAAEHGTRGNSYLLSGRWCSVPELAQHVKAIVPAAQPPRITTPIWVARMGAPLMTTFAKVAGREPLYTSESLDALQANRNYNHELAAVELGHAPRPLEQSIRDVYRWFAQAGRIPKQALRDNAEEEVSWH